MPLTDAKVRVAKPAEKAYRLPDYDGLHLFVTPSGIRSWRLRYRRAGKEQTLVLGRYPQMGLADARKARDDARNGMVAGQLPQAAPEPAPRPTFEEVAQRWHATNANRWKSGHAADVLASFKAEVFPAFGTLPIADVTPAVVLAALRHMEVRGAVETARRIKQRCSRVFAFAMSEGLCTGDPTAGLQGALVPLPPKGHRPALLDLDDLRALVAVLDAATGQPAVKMAMRFLALTAARPGEVAGMPWSEVMFGDEPIWHIPAERTKTPRSRARVTPPRAVPLSPQAVSCLEAMRPFSGQSRFVFPGAFNMSRPMSDGALIAMLLRLGYQDRHCPHGWRASFSSIMNERYPADRQAIDLMLGHKPESRVEAAYNRAQHMPRRRELAGLWADLLLEGAVSAEELVAGQRRAT